jgi:sulfate adenylyltransferase
VHDGLIAPHGGRLMSLMVDERRALELKRTALDGPSWELSPRQVCDLELLLTGGFSPLRGFMEQGDHESVCTRMRLSDGTLWPMPITLDIPEALAGMLSPGTPLGLRDPEGTLLAVLNVAQVWRADREAEARQVFGTTSREHPGVAHLLDLSRPWYAGGRLEGLRLPVHYDFRPLRRTPSELREEFARLGWRRVVAFQTRNPMHRAHQELTLRAGKETQANLLIHPVVGMTRPGDLDHYTRVRCYESILNHYPPQMAMLSLLPLAMRMGGPREAVWHAIIRKNFGCTHFIVGRDHAGPGQDSGGRPFYGPYDAQELLRQYEGEIGMRMVPFQNMVYLEGQDRYVPENEIPPGERALSLSGTELRRRLMEGREIPRWFTFPEVAAELQRRHPPRQRQGFTVFLTGLCGAGKSTLANALMVRFLEMGGRPVTLLGGDQAQRHPSSDAGSTRDQGAIHVRRIGYVASEITKNGGIAICDPIAPEDKVRKEVRARIEPLGGFLLVHVSTPISVCEERDGTGSYAKARARLINEFPGISAPYEVPSDAELVLDTTDMTPEEATQEILLRLEREGFLGDNTACS